MKRVSAIKKHLPKGRETGHVLVMVLILLAVGSILIAPVMSFMGTGIKAGGVYEVKTGQLYSSDAGIEDARWQISSNGDGILIGNPGNLADLHESSYSIRDDIFVSGLPPYLVLDEDAGSMNAFDETGNLIEIYTLTAELIPVLKIYDAEGNPVDLEDIELDETGDLIDTYFLVGDKLIPVLRIYDSEGNPLNLEDIELDEAGNLIDVYTITDEFIPVLKLYEYADSEYKEVTLFDVEYEEITDEDDNIIGYGDLINVYIKIGGKFIQILNIYTDDEGEPVQIKNIYYSVRYYLPKPVNNHTVEVKLTRFTGDIYIIQSTAQGETSTTITVWTGDKAGDYSSITDHILCTPGSINSSPNLNLVYPPNNPPYEGWPGDWPDTQQKIEEFIQFFYWDVRNEEPYPYGIIDVSGVDRSEGPLFRDGTMDIYNSPNTLATITLEGTLYITGKTKIGNEKQSMNLDLNGNTIFVESNLTGGAGPALLIGKKCNLIGPGVIVAIGDVYFEPNVISGEEGPVFIMSASGTTTLQPNGEFYGAVAGKLLVGTKPNVNITYPEDGFPDLNFPGLYSYPKIWGILTYNID